MKITGKIAVLLFACLMTLKVNGQCGAVEVSSDDTVICVPQVVKFKATNIPPGTTLEWNMGMGAGYVSSDSTYSNLFNVVGDFTISLRLTYADNSKCTITKTGFIKGKGKPVVNIATSMNVICNFNDSIILTDNSYKSYSRDWLLNNTLYKNGPVSLKVLYSYPAGYKSLTVFLKDSFGCTANKTMDSIVYVADSVQLDFAADKDSGCIPKPVNFANLSDTMNNRIASWNWSFPGAVPSTSSAYEPKNIIYNSNDTFDVSLMVTTKRGCSYSASKKDFLQFADSIILAASFSKTALCGGEILTINYLNSRSYLTDLSITPGSYVIWTDSAKKKTVSFTDLGTYSVYISDELNGCKSERTFTNAITVNGPLAAFSFPNYRGCTLPDTFTGINTSLVGGGITATYKWELYFDTVAGVVLQTSTSSPFKAIANYETRYTVRLIATGSNGCKDSVTRATTFIVEKMKPKFSWGPVPACSGEFIDFSNLTKPGSSKVPNKYQWTFYNLNNTVLYKDTAVNPRLTYPASGSYSVKLMAHNSIGCKDSVTLIKQVVIQSPNPAISLSDSNICLDQVSKFKVVYQDTNYYRKYQHYWVLQHTDTPGYSPVFTGDSVFVSVKFPGKYNIMYITHAKQSGKCLDTFRLNTQFKVSGDYYKTYASPLKGCNPFISKLTAKKLWSYNYKNGNPNNSVFEWQSYPDTTLLKIIDPDSLETDALIKKAGTFYFSYKYTNSSGCDETIPTFSILSGVKASFLLQQNGCIGKPVTMTNTSDPDAVKYKWFVKDSVNSFSFLPSDTSKNAKVLFTKEGLYQVGLITYGSGQCTDTGYRTIQVSNIRASFSSNDTLNYCAPIIASVSAVTHPYIYKYSWLFSMGDTVTQNLSTISTLFSENTGPQGADVRLIVDALGCSDTLEKMGYIKVIGPIPKFVLGNNLGCEKLAVTFTNQSTYYNRFYLEYGDGTYLDSVNFNTHTYEIFDRTLPQQVFKPKLFVIDSLGCIAYFKPKDSVVVLRSPNANFDITNDTGCADLLVTFRNTSIGAISYKWDFEGDGTFDNFTPFPQKYYPAGDYSPVLVAKGLNGCEDKLTGKYAIKAYAPPEASFVPSSDTICYKGSISFTAQSFPSSGDITKWLWDFGNPFTYKDSSTKQNPTYTFTNAYLNQVILFVTDIHNCTDTFDRYVYVNDTLGLLSKPVNFVTVQNNDILVNWSKATSNRFSRYNLYRDNSTKSFIDSFNNRSDTTEVVSPVNVNNISYCFTINTVDKCNVKGPYAPSHCTIFLQVSMDVNLLKLDWTAYTGWSKGVEKYLIYRSENGGPFRLHDSTVTTSYAKDNNLCNKTYCYYVIAKQKNGKWKSQSNTVCKTPVFVMPTEPVKPVVTTVLSDVSTYTRWQPYTFIKNVKTYHIDRYYPGGSGIQSYARCDSTGFIDKGNTVNTNEFSYTYTIRAEDHCGNFSPESSVARTVLLTGESVDYIAKMKWNPYEKWFSGVKQYEIYMRESDQFNFLAKVDQSVNEFEYDYSKSKMDDSICFRVVALKDSADSLRSYSNMLCMVSDPQLWVPSAFSPNKDGVNEVFLPRAILIYNKTGNPILDYHLEIYNRWGEKVFESNDVNIGWDGTFRNEQCVEGNYLYYIKALGLDGNKNFNVEGVVTLLR